MEEGLNGLSLCLSSGGAACNELPVGAFQKPEDKDETMKTSKTRIVLGIVTALVLLSGGAGADSAIDT